MARLMQPTPAHGQTIGIRIHGNLYPALDTPTRCATSYQQVSNEIMEEVTEIIEAHVTGTYGCPRK